MGVETSRRVCGSFSALQVAVNELRVEGSTVFEGQTPFKNQKVGFKGQNYPGWRTWVVQIVSGAQNGALDHPQAPGIRSSYRFM